ncbi:cupin domain-containing protein [Paenibacillus sp. P96]|uniref:Cupin domain-containing protein n=1 Tax=Paenibacillus zeirhizosphaerae TaxID=2987519 RepID=A0ABT9FRV7_9BACL|nr:cupin domain-containing protein [Paenibacillus sp. P96]MDP4097404.1 cupin domain-containing protein [Paenibacillus sp. P96]
MRPDSVMTDLSSPSLNLSFDLNTALFFQQDAQNFILQQFANQVPVMQNLGLLDIYLSKGHSVEAHWHPNAAELVYAIQGEANISILNPFTLQVLSYRIQPPQTVYIPMGWWHWEIATMDQTHLLAIFDSHNAQVVFGSDVLRKTPPEVFQQIYGVNAAQMANVLKPIERTVVIGPPIPRDIEWRIGSQA